jgi:hypothetical protein
MKIKITFLSLLAVSAALVASAQVVENDDMYFNSKDRAKIQASKPLTLKNISTEHELATSINPTDSYSARNVNPEYISQSQINSTSVVEPAPYFIPDYTPTAVNQNLYNNSSSYWNNNGYATAGNNPYFGMMPGYGSPYGNHYSSMYGYNPYSYGYNNYNSFYNTGWSSFLSLGFGMGGYSPWGSSWAYGGSPFWNNYYGWNSYNNGGWNSYYPRNVVIINNGDYGNRNVAYGKRASRSSDLNNIVNSSNRSSVMTTTDSQGRVRGANGRTSGDGTTNSNNYYQRGWRTNPETNSAARSNWSNSGRSGVQDNNSGFSNGRNNNSSFFDNGGSRSSNWGGGNSSFSGGGGRSGGSVGGGSSSGARRGRD